MVLSRTRNQCCSPWPTWAATQTAATAIAAIASAAMMSIARARMPPILRACGLVFPGSQFLITTVAAPRLDNKHVAFGRVSVATAHVIRYVASQPAASQSASQPLSQPVSGRKVSHAKPELQAVGSAMRLPYPAHNILLTPYSRPQGGRGGRQPLRRHDSARQDRGVRPAGGPAACGGKPGNARLLKSRVFVCVSRLFKLKYVFRLMSSNTSSSSNEEAPVQKVVAYSPQASCFCTHPTSCRGAGRCDKNLSSSYGDWCRC